MTADEFEKEAEGSEPKTQWGMDRRASRVKDMFVNVRRTSEFRSFYTHAYRRNFDDAVIRDIDISRGAHPSNDILPGLIRTETGFRCSVWTPNGYEKREFSEEAEARIWIITMKQKYKDYCHDAY